jgi:hypothetical protein
VQLSDEGGQDEECFVVEVGNFEDFFTGVDNSGEEVGNSRKHIA